MVRITEDLVRKSAEHNEGIISTLEELALHQRDIEKIENLNKWCRELKILDLTSNLIPKIENLNRLKKLEYLKLGLNNIECVENLEGCESLTKLDLTVNFIGELTSIENLCDLENLREMYLTGNPCTKFENYREFVIGTLSQLEKLDGEEVSRSERILAFQALSEIRGEILEQQKRYKTNREREKNKEDFIDDDDDVNEEERERRFWNEPTPFTPESRNKIYQHKQKKEGNNQQKRQDPPPPRKLVTKDGRRLNVNEAKVKFELTEDEEGKSLVLDVALFRFLDTSLCSADVHPTYVQVVIKGKILQLVLPEEVNAEKSFAQRSQASGRLIVTMPKITPQITHLRQFVHFSKKKPVQQDPESKIKKLKVDPSCLKTVSLDICKKHVTLQREIIRTTEKPNDDDFIDDDQVPPLEEL